MPPASLRPSFREVSLYVFILLTCTMRPLANGPKAPVPGFRICGAPHISCGLQWESPRMIQVE